MSGSSSSGPSFLVEFTFGPTAQHSSRRPDAALVTFVGDRGAAPPEAERPIKVNSSDRIDSSSFNIHVEV